MPTITHAIESFARAVGVASEGIRDFTQAVMQHNHGPRQNRDPIRYDLYCSAPACNRNIWTVREEDIMTFAAEMGWQLKPTGWLCPTHGIRAQYNSLFTAVDEYVQPLAVSDGEKSPLFHDGRRNAVERTYYNFGADMRELNMRLGSYYSATVQDGRTVIRVNSET